jgi:integrase
MATTKLKIRNDLAKQSAGPTAIYVQYTYQSKPKYFNTGKKIEPEYWDAAGQCVKRSYRGYTTLNDFIKGKRRTIDEIIIDCQRRKIEPTPQYVSHLFDRLSATRLPEVNKDLLELYEQWQAENLGKLGRLTLKTRRTLLTHLMAYQEYSKQKITLESITLDFHSKFTSFLISVRNLSPNTIGGLIKVLKTFLGKMVEKGINTNLAFQNKSFNKPSAPVDLIALTQDELDQLFNADLSSHGRLAKVRDLFVFGCVTGLRFSDMENLKAENFRTDSIDFITLKTRDRLSVPLVPQARAILAKYEGRLPEVMSNQKMNDYLKELCQLVGIDEPVQKVRYIGSTRVSTSAPKYEMVSTHTARRTFITLALERGSRPEIVMRLTGHKDIRTMMRYVRLTDKLTHQEFLRPYGEGTGSPGDMKAI